MAPPIDVAMIVPTQDRVIEFRAPLHLDFAISPREEMAQLPSKTGKRRLRFLEFIGDAGDEQAVGCVVAGRVHG